MDIEDFLDDITVSDTTKEKVLDDTKNIDDNTTKVATAKENKVSSDTKVEEQSAKVVKDDNTKISVPTGFTNDNTSENAVINVENTATVDDTAESATTTLPDTISMNNIYATKAEDLMAKMINQGIKVNAVISSPPYGNSRGKAKSSLTQKARNNHEVRYDVFTEDKTDNEYIQWMLDLFADFDKILAPNGVILWNVNYSTDNQSKKKAEDRRLYQPNTLVWKVIYNLIEHSNFTTADKIVWKKSNALPNNSSPNKLTRITEEVFVLVRKDEFDTFLTNKQVKSVSKTGQKYYENIVNFVEAKNNDGANPLNKATYSTDLITKLIDMYAVKRDDTQNIIFDPFMGTGTTANACLYKSFNYLGSELSHNQVKFAQERLEATKKAIQEGKE